MSETGRSYSPQPTPSGERVQSPQRRCVATTDRHRQCQRPEVESTRLCWQHKSWKPYSGWKPGPEPIYDDRGTD